MELFRSHLHRMGGVKTSERDLELLQVGIVFLLQDEAGFADTDFGARRVTRQRSSRACDDGASIVAAVHGTFRPHFDRVKDRAERSSVEVEMIGILCGLKQFDSDVIGSYAGVQSNSDSLQSVTVHH